MFRFILILAILVSPAVKASSTLYYSGTARVIDLKTGKESQEEMVVEKTINPKNNLITEIACVKRNGSAASVYPVYMKVQGNKILQISNAPNFKGTLSGTGKLQGKAWKWNYLTFSMLFDTGKGNIRIEDDNFVVNSTLIARKRIFYREIPVQLWEEEAKEINLEEFSLQKKHLDCPAF